MVSTFAGSGIEGFDNGPDTMATFNFPRGCVIDYDDHRLYVVDYNNHAVRIVHLSEITGVNNDILKTSFEIFPNPAGKEIRIKAEVNHTNLVIRIFNLNGETVKVEDSISVFPVNLDISDLDTGMYYVGLINNGIPLGMKKLIIIK